MDSRADTMKPATGRQSVFCGQATWVVIPSHADTRILLLQAVVTLSGKIPKRWSLAVLPKYTQLHQHLTKRQYRSPRFNRLIDSGAISCERGGICLAFRTLQRLRTENSGLAALLFQAQLFWTSIEQSCFWATSCDSSRYACPNIAL